MYWSVSFLLSNQSWFLRENMCFSGIKLYKGYKEETENAFDKTKKTNAEMVFTVT